MKPKIIIILLLALFIAIFSLQNAEVVQIKLLFWDINCPRVILILISVIIGLVIGIFVGNPKQIKNPEEITADEETENTNL